MTLRILAHQMEALGQDTANRFAAMMTEHLRIEHPELVQHIHGDLLAWVTRAVGIASAADVDTEPEAAQLVLMLAVLGDAPWIDEVLARRDLISIGKLNLLLSRATERGLPLEDVLFHDEVELP